MIESFTKNKQPQEIVNQMIFKAFHGMTAKSIKELTEGFFNVAYLIELPDGREVVLKIAPPQDATVMTHEINIMFSEVEAMRLVAERTDVPAANILFYDNSHDLCAVDYFFMDKLPGRSYAYNEHFYHGYGIGSLTDRQKIRAKWYDMYLFLISALECDYRHYAGRDAYNWAVDMLQRNIAEISGR